MGTALALIYVVGLVGAVFVVRARAGLPLVSVLSLSTVLTSLPWGITAGFKVVFWPLPLVFWLATGRPPSRWRVVPARGGVRVRRLEPGGES